MPLHFALYLAVAGAVALVVQLFALAEADLYFGKALFVDEHAERHYGEAFFLSLHVPLVQLFSLQQQFAVVYGQVAGVAGIYILGYVQGGSLYKRFQTRQWELKLFLHCRINGSAIHYTGIESLSHYAIETFGFKYHSNTCDSLCFSVLRSTMKSRKPWSSRNSER